MANKKIIKLNSLIQTDGKLRPEQGESNASTNFKPTTLEQILNGSNIFNKYSTSDKDVYLNEINGMNLAELRTHAVKLGAFVPSSSRERLIKQLLGEFQKYTNNLKGRPEVLDSNLRLSKTKIKEGLDIMRAVK